MPFTVLIVALIQATNEYHHIGRLGFLYSLTNQILFRAIIIKTTTYRHSVIALYGITDITTSEVNFRLIKASFDTIKRKNLSLYLQRTGAASYGHHFDSVLTYNEDALRLCWIYRQQRLFLLTSLHKIILEQDNTFLGNLQSSIIMAFRAKETIGLLTVHRSAIEQTEQTAYLLIEFLRGEFAFFNQTFVGICQIIGVIGISCSH